MPKVLVFSQDDSLNCELSDLLSQNCYTVSTFSRVDEAINAIREESYDLIFIDFPQNNLLSQELVASVHCFHDLLPIIVLTDADKVDIAYRAVKNGATTYVTKPLNADALLLTMSITLSNANIMIENLLYKRSLQKTDGFSTLVTSSEPMLKIYALIEKIAPSDSPVMLRGEAGTGKETIARRIHAKSRRGKYGFAKLDCAALPGNMEDAELFGYVRDIDSEHPENIPGVFEENNSGTVFLDNIDALPMNTQIKMLYMLRNKKIQRNGSSKMTNIDVRLVVGSTCDLYSKTITREFCEDLYKKLNVVPIVLLPLRERRKDIPRLVEDFLMRFANENSKNVDISSQALAVLCEYDWPGNITQLENLVERLVAANETGRIGCDELPDELFREVIPEVKWGKIVNDKLDDIIPLKKYLQLQERLYMEKVLEHSGGDKCLAAKKLDISLASFYRKWHEDML
ncbi:MAG: sigma-54 dependent transcriptional regulator [Victivallaceae bacterium]|nr:sigma-54 dependent transcriptional regulator [Victivallaceae bacterium]